MYNNKVFLAFSCFNHSQIINLTIAIEVEIVDVSTIIIDCLLKFLEVLCFAEDVGNCIQVKLFGDFVLCGSNRDSLIRPCVEG